ncbi:MAG: penicillin-binding protein 2 [Synergistaceae bacterium]|jgi:penicillin-binding protein 2|nr:penicillin-binding protein 2 [Synergistaceae bacterium]
MLEIRDLLDARLKALLYGILGTLGILFMGLYFFQVIHADKYVRLAYGNRLRLIRFSPPRGEIYDRNGVPLAVNETTFSVMGYPLDLDKPDMLPHLSKLLSIHGIPMSVEDLEKTIKKQRGAPYRVIRLVPNLTMAQMAELVADPEFPNQLFPLPVWRRIYPAGALAANVTGYVGEISESELRDSRPGEYVGGDLVGKGGIERYYEERLRGVAGEEAIEVNAKGRKVRTIDLRASEKGQDIRLTLDMGAQKRATELLSEYKGALVLMDVKTGAVLVLASSPTYDNNPLAWGVSTKEWQEIMEDADKPMLDRSIAGVYPPASTFKALVALAALEEEVVTPSTAFLCSGSLKLSSRTFRCWRRSGHGSVNLLGALQNSCDVYFYQVGMKLGIDRLLKWAKKFGLGSPTGIDLPGESAGNAAGPEWKKARFKENWYQGDTVNYSIGQGFLLLTPLQIARLYAAIANGGYLVTPHVASTNFRPPADLAILPDKLAVVQKGLDYVVSRGTGSRAGRFGVTVAGKTGTAQNSHGLDHALFAGYAPADDPQYVAVAMVEAGEHGSSVASPIVGEILAHILSHPAESYDPQTLDEIQEIQEIEEVQEN